MQTFDPTRRKGKVGPLLTAMRTRATLLIDKVDLEGFGEWIAAEQMAVVMHMQEAARNGAVDRKRLGRDPPP